MRHTWEDNFQMLKKYSAKNGTTRIPSGMKYKGYALGSFVARCRRQQLRGILGKKKKELLESIGFSFSPYEDDWNNAFKLAEMYYNTNGDLLVKQNEIFEDFNLGMWISRQRTNYYSSKAKMKQERIQALESIGMVWNANDASWELRYKAAKKYYAEFGDLDILIDTTYDGIRLGSWISNQRTARKNKKDSHVLTEERIQRLDDIGMIWEANSSKQVSFPEKALFFYFKQVFPKAIDNDRSLGFEVDVLDKDHGIGMEYDGRLYHQNIHKDYEKNRNAKQHIKLYRFREKGCPVLMDGLSINIPIDKVGDYKYLSIVYEKTINNICKQFNYPKIDVDIYRDIDSILSLYKRSTDRFEFWFNEAEAYYKKHGDLLVKSTDEKNRRLCLFLQRKRSAYFGKRRLISQDQINRLNSIGMVWDVEGYYFNIKYELAKQYYLERGDLLIPRGTIIDDIDIGNFIAVLRRAYNYGTLKPQVIQKMEDIGMVWNPRDEAWEKHYNLLKEIYDKTGTVNIPFSQEIQGVKIGKWLYKQIQAYWKLDGRYIDEDRIQRLEALEINWHSEEYSVEKEVRKQKQWMKTYNLLTEYIYTFGIQTFDTRVEYKNVKIGQWVSRQRMNKQLSEERKQLLQEIGIVLDVAEEEWQKMFELVKEFVLKYGWNNLTQKTEYKGKKIGKWVDTRRGEKRGKRGIPGVTLTEEKISMLESIGIIWDIQDNSWMNHYFALKKYLKSHTWEELPKKTVYNDMRIGDWVVRQRMIKKGTSRIGQLSNEQIRMLEELGIVWDTKEEKWQQTYELVKEYVELYGWPSLKNKTEYKGIKIGTWVSRQRGARKGCAGRLKITDNRIKLLDDIGMYW